MEIPLAYDKTFFNLIDSLKKIEEPINGDFIDNENNNILKDVLKIASAVNLDDNKTKRSEKNKIKNHIEESIKDTLYNVRQIVIDNIFNYFFFDNQGCGIIKTIPPLSEVRLKPEQFDFFDLLRISPESSVGYILYETNDTTNKVNFNKELFNIFLTTNTYTFISEKGTPLFDIYWDSIAQEYVITNFLSGTFNKFFDDYYSSIDFPDTDSITKTAILHTFLGDGSETKLFNINSEVIFNILSKIFSICSGDLEKKEPLNQTPIGTFDDNDDVIINMFNYEEIVNNEIDNNKLNKIQKFTSCESIEIPTNTNNIKDFTYLIRKNNKPLEQIVAESIRRVSNEFYVKSNKEFPKENFEVSLINTLNENLVYSVFTSLLTPKLFFPIVFFRKIITGTYEKVTVLFKNLFKLIYNIIKDIFWEFLRNLWKRIKKDILIFIKKYSKILLNEKILRYKIIIKILLSFFKKIKKIDNCDTLYSTLINSVNNILNVKPKIMLPSIILALSDRLPGYSKGKAYSNIIQNLNNAGITTDDLYGRENKLKSLIKSTIDGLSQEFDENSFIKVSNKEFCIPTPAGPLCFPPGVITSNGKMF